MKMKDETVFTCRLCLASCENNSEAVEETVKMLDIFLLQIDISVSANPCICASCAESLKHCYEFKSACLSTEDYIRSCTGGNMTLDLKQAYLKKYDNKYSNIPEDCSVCRLCMELVNSGCFMSLNDEAKDVVAARIMLGTYFPELDLNITNDPVACISCYVSLQSSSNFLKNCLDVEEKMKNSRESEGTGENQVKLNSMSQFTSTTCLFVCESREDSQPGIKYEHFAEEGSQEPGPEQEELNTETDDSSLARVEEDRPFLPPQLCDYVIHDLINIKKFSQYTFEEKLKVKEAGRPLPDIFIECTGASRGKPYKRLFKRDIYARNNWICGCKVKNALFCFPCVLFGGDRAWTQVGIRDLVHLSEKIKKHEGSKTHINNEIEYVALGTANIVAQLDTAYWMSIQKYNDNVTKNRYVLSKVINCVKFCGLFDVALCGHDESETSEDMGIFRGLINFSAELDKTLEEHLKHSTVFEGTSKEIQNDILDCMLEECQERIMAEIKESPYLAVIADETTDVSLKSQLVVIFRYCHKNGDPVERFWTYLVPSKLDANSLSTSIIDVLNPIVGSSKNKLIAQSYDGAGVMSGRHTGVQAKIKEKYPYAHFVHCYAHQLDLIMSNVASVNTQVRLFFGNLQEIPAFFSRSPQPVEMLNKIVGKKIPHGAPTQWNFNIRTVNVVYEHRESLIECMEEIEENIITRTMCSTASSIRRMLEDAVFIFWLSFFHRIMPHVDILFNQLQKSNIDPTYIKNCITVFEQNINFVRNSMDDIVKEASDQCSQPLQSKRRRPNNKTVEHRITAFEVCDVIINTAKDRFHFKDHLVAASLLSAERFKDYCKNLFLNEKLDTTCAAYPNIDQKRLKTELSVIYTRQDCRNITGAIPLLKFLNQNNLSRAFREVKKLLEILITTPMSTAEAERCFSTSKRVKTFLRNSMTEDRLVALSMLSIEKKLVSEIPNFNEKVIDRFAARKNRKIDLIYKK